MSATSPEPDDIIMKSTRPLLCAVCREVKCGSVVLPGDQAVCGACVVIGLGNMIDDSRRVRDEGSRAFAPSPRERGDLARLNESERKTCRRCSECVGQEHHWIDSYQYEGEGTENDPDLACKHCDAIAFMCLGCDVGMPATGQICKECRESGVSE